MNYENEETTSHGGGNVALREFYGLVESRGKGSRADGGFLVKPYKWPTDSKVKQINSR